MTLSSSLNAGVAGLNVNASKLGTISDNIANSQTAGYKRAGTEFASLVISESGAGKYAAGGVTSTSFRLVDEKGGLISTDNATDIAIGGRGLIPVTTISSLDNPDGATPTRFVSTGSFRVDENGFMTTASGFALLGWPANRDGAVPSFPRDSTSALSPVQINTGALFGSPTTEIGLGVNLPAAEAQAGASGDPIPLTIEYFDNLSASQSLDLTFTPTIPAAGASNEWTVEISDSQTDPASNPVASFVVGFDTTAAAGGSIATVTGAAGGAYDAATGIFTFSTGGGPIDLDIGTPGDNAGLTQLATAFGPTGVSKNGSPVGVLTDVSVDENGLVQGVFEGGFTRTLYQIPLADFPNLNGLKAADGQSFIASLESGAMYLWDAGDGPTGSVVSFAQEGSASDIAAELTSLITTQRAYSSNATVIRTVDEMLQETTNIKR
ncbi:flagellar hook-basal body complex protein [Pikeienuella piscinae]|uniref:Flagellar hook protein FlgE n=1 Tax=Pikeienuella piscinae TaxID=2748098 RepID=A0A7L5BVH8_9RHOB|nr:flagellar hook-basal body complex protein [Pikeienuella piscinae]QIE55391.1 flagellar hook-basal body complex protein [Pikeienuella piscinae]